MVSGVFLAAEHESMVIFALARISHSKSLKNLQKTETLWPVIAGD